MSLQLKPEPATLMLHRLVQATNRAAADDELYYFLVDGGVRRCVTARAVLEAFDPGFCERTGPCASLGDAHAVGVAPKLLDDALRYLQDCVWGVRDPAHNPALWTQVALPVRRLMDLACGFSDDAVERVCGPLLRAAAQLCYAEMLPDAVRVLPTAREVDAFARSALESWAIASSSCTLESNAFLVDAVEELARRPEHLALAKRAAERLRDRLCARHHNIVSSNASSLVCDALREISLWPPHVTSWWESCTYTSPTGNVVYVDVGFLGDWRRLLACDPTTRFERRFEEVASETSIRIKEARTKEDVDVRLVGALLGIKGAADIKRTEGFGSWRDRQASRDRQAARDRVALLDLDSDVGARSFALAWVVAHACGLDIDLERVRNLNFARADRILRITAAWSSHGSRVGRRRVARALRGLATFVLCEVRDMSLAQLREAEAHLLLRGLSLERALARHAASRMATKPKRADDADAFHNAYDPYLAMQQFDQSKAKQAKQAKRGAGKVDPSVAEFLFTGELLDVPQMCVWQWDAMVRPKSGSGSGPGSGSGSATTEQVVEAYALLHELSYICDQERERHKIKEAVAAVVDEIDRRLEDCPSDLLGLLGWSNASSGAPHATVRSPFWRCSDDSVAAIAATLEERYTPKRLAQVVLRRLPDMIDDGSWFEAGAFRALRRATCAARN